MQTHVVCTCPCVSSNAHVASHARTAHSARQRQDPGCRWPGSRACGSSGGYPTASGPCPPHPVPWFTWRRRGDPSAGRAVPVTSNVSCRISCGGRGLAVGSGGTLKGEEAAPLLGSPACATPPPHLELTPSAEPGLGGPGRRARCSVLFWDRLGEGKAPCWLLRF